MTQMEKEYFGAAVFRDCELSSLMLHFFAIIGRKLHQNAPHENISSLRQIRTARAFFHVNAHCTEDLSLDELANEAGFSKYHFARLFKEITGTTCHNYLLGRRLLFAKPLLADFSLPITEVAMRSGFNSLATFNRIFKFQIGCTPSEFRKLGLGFSVPQE